MLQADGSILKSIPDHNFIKQSRKQKRIAHRTNLMPLPGACAAASGLKVGDAVIVRAAEM